MRACFVLATVVAFGSVMAPPRVTEAQAEAPAAGRPARLRGAVVVGIGPEARDPAKALARLVYADPALGTPLDEAMARALVGETGADTPALQEIRATVSELGEGCTPSCESWPVSRQLLAGLGLDLGADLVVAVEAGGEPGVGRGMPVARVLRVAERRFVPVQLSVQQPGGNTPFDWSGSLPVLRSLLTASPKPHGAAQRSDAGPAPTGSKAARPVGASPATPAPSEPDEPIRVLSSPWFWGGLGVLVAAGVTVFALSRTSLSGPGSVQINGRVSP
jgi:hypothetical protein